MNKHFPSIVWRGREVGISFQEPTRFFALKNVTNYDNIISNKKSTATPWFFVCQNLLSTFQEWIDKYFDLIIYTIFINRYFIKPEGKLWVF